jgi:hypothetical protein
MVAVAVVVRIKVFNFMVTTRVVSPRRRTEGERGDGLVLAEEVTLSVQEAMQGHLMPHAAKGRGAVHVATSRVDFH